MLRMKAATERPKGWSKWMGKWHKAFLPTWVISLARTSVCWAAAHRGHEIMAQGYTWSQSSSYSGGCPCRSSDWADPPLGPPSLLSLLNPCVTPTQDVHGSRGETQC